MSSLPSPSFLSTQVTTSNLFWLPPPAAGAKHVAVICGGWEQCSADYRTDRRSFPYHAVEFVAKGSGTLVLAGRTHELRPGVVFTYGPRVPHIIVSSREAPLLKYFADFVGRDGTRLLADCGLAAAAPVQLANVAAVRTRFDELIGLGSVADARTRRTCALQFELLLHAIARAVELPSPGARRLRETFIRCREFIENNFREVSSLAEVSAACHVDSSHICRVFRQFHSETPLQYLLRLRMQWAAERLLRSAARVNEVADELQMDPFHFSRLFKRVHGLSPANFSGRPPAPAGGPKPPA